MTNKILVLLTGGTICSFIDEEGRRYCDASKVNIIEAFKQGNSPFAGSVVFESLMPLDILSENMTLAAWEILLDCFRNDVNFSDYAGIIVLHGTDTLAYTTSLLSFALAGVDLPVILVSSQLPLSFENANGNANFKAAVELIMNGILPNVYAVYKNSDGKIYLHYGAHLKQCENFNDDFFSKDCVEISNTNATFCGKKFETNHKYFERLSTLSSGVLKIEPYTGLDYNMYNLEGVHAIVHGTYHSETACVSGESSSLLSLLSRCEGIPVFLAPCSADTYKYVTTGEILAGGAVPVSLSTNTAYIKALLGVSLGFSGDELISFMNKSINFEEVEYE